MLKSISGRFALTALLAIGGSASALAQSPVGIWVDHTGRGAVEIKECGQALCGKVVWVKSAADKEGCNIQIIGDAKQRGNRWEGGWIYDPEARQRYDLELTPMGAQKLKVFGYAGIKMFGETMTWTRAPEGLERCDAPAVQASVQPAQPVVAAAPEVAARPLAQPPAALGGPKPETQFAAPSAEPGVQAQLQAPRQEPIVPPPAAAEPAAPQAVQPPAVAPNAEPAPPPGRRASSGLPDLKKLGLGDLKFEQKQVAGKKKECTIRIPDFAAFSFEC